MAVLWRLYRLLLTPPDLGPLLLLLLWLLRVQGNVLHIIDKGATVRP